MKRILIAAIILLAVSANVFATSYTYPFRVGTTSIDSVWVIWKYKSTGTKVDSFHFVATSGNLDKDTSFTSRVAESSYVLQYRWYWQTLASATQKYAVSYDDVAAILPTATAVTNGVFLDTGAAANDGKMGGRELTTIVLKVADTSQLRSNINAGRFLASDTTSLRQNIAAALGVPLKPSDTTALRQNIVAAMAVPLKPTDTSALRQNIVAAIGTPFKPSDTSALRQNIAAAIGTPLKPSDTAQLRNNIVTAIGIPFKPSDTTAFRLNLIAAMPTPLKPSDTDELRQNIVAGMYTGTDINAIDTNTHPTYNSAWFKRIYGKSVSVTLDSAAIAQLSASLTFTLPDSLWTKLGALYSKEFGSGLMHVKYISSGGDNSDGSTWKKAYTTPNKIAVGDSNTIFMVDKGLFDTVHVNILARNVAILANTGGGVIFQNDSIAYNTGQKDAINVYKPNFYVNGVEFIGHTFSNGDEDSLASHGIRNPWPNAITVYGTGHNATIENCYFGPRNYKSIVTIDSIESGKCDTIRAPLNLTIRNNTFRNNQMFSIDVNPHGGLIEGNTFTGINANPVNGAAAIQLFTRSRNVLITNNFFDSVGIAIACQNDTNTVVSKNTYGYMLPGYGRFTSSGSVHRTTDEPDLYQYADVKPDGFNWLTDPGMEAFHVDVRNPDPWVVYLSKGSTPPDTSFPDARVVQTTVRTGNWSWYAACTQATVQQATLVQTVRLDSASYVISCMAYGNAGGTIQIKAVPLSGTLADSSYKVFTIDSTNTWRPLVLEFNHSNSGMVKVEYIVHSYPSVTTAYLDDFSVTKEPTANVTGVVATAVLADSVTASINATRDSLNNPLSTLRNLNSWSAGSGSVPIGPSLAGVRLSRRIDVRVAAMQQLNIPPNGSQAMSPGVVDNVIAQASQTISGRLPAVERLQLVAGSSTATSYALNSDFVRLASVVKMSGDSALIPLDYTVVGEVYGKSQGVGGLIPDYDRIDKPRFAWTFGQRLFLAPKPQTPDTFVVAYYSLDRPLVDDNDTTDIMEDYRQIWLNYVCSRLTAIAGDYVASAYYQSLLPPVLKEEKK